MSKWNMEKKKRWKILKLIKFFQILNLMSSFLLLTGVDQWMDSQCNLQKKLFYYFCIAYHLVQNSTLFLLEQILKNYSKQANYTINNRSNKQWTKSKIFKLLWEEQKFWNQWLKYFHGHLMKSYLVKFTYWLMERLKIPKLLSIWSK